MTTPYPDEELDEDHDDGTMPNSKAALAEAIVGHRIVFVDHNVPIPPEKAPYGQQTATAITLDNGKRVFLVERDDCCAYTNLAKFLLNVQNIEHAVGGVGTTDGYTKWHIFCDAGDIAEMEVGWSAGNIGYYGYGFDIIVEELY